jgi:hypothetical protein
MHVIENDVLDPVRRPHAGGPFSTEDHPSNCRDKDEPRVPGDDNPGIRLELPHELGSPAQVPPICLM